MGTFMIDHKESYVEYTYWFCISSLEGACLLDPNKFTNQFGGPK